MMILLLLTAVLLTAAVIDLRSQRIPNWLTFPSMLFAMVWHASFLGVPGILFSLKGIAVGIGILIFPYLMGGMGAGDAKLMGVVGAFLGPKMVFYAFLFSALIGGFYALMLLVRRRLFIKTTARLWSAIILFITTWQVASLPESSTGERPKLCYGIAIAFGTLLSVLMTNNPYSATVYKGFL